MLYKSIKNISVLAALFMIFMFSPVLAGPLSTNYELKDYGFGSAGTTESGSSSTNYKLFGAAGEVEGGKTNSSSYIAGGGLNYILQANVPPAPTFTNPATYYNKLKLILNNGSNPSDAKFAIAISTDAFTTITNYVQSDATVGPVLNLIDWQTYTGWGGATGIFIVGLLPGVTYTVKVEAQQGNFTQTGFGPTSQASTSNPSLTFDIDIAATNIDTSPPYALSLGQLSAGSVTTAINKVWVDIDTNATGGGMVYLKDSNGGLVSTTASYTINAVTNNLVSVSEGYGFRGSTASQVSGGPMVMNSPFNGAGNNVGIASTIPRIIFDSSSQPVVAGRASFEIQAKASALTKAGNDYTDTLTVIASAGF